MRLKGTRKSKAAARILRRTMTLPEVLLWQQLRKRPGGHRFRRQHPAGRYVLDFFCAPAKLAIEVDGEAHTRAGMLAGDGVRDDWLRSQGIRVLRIAARDVLADLDAVMRWIASEAGGDDPPPPPAAVPLPR